MSEHPLAAKVRAQVQAFMDLLYNYDDKGGLRVREDAAGLAIVTFGQQDRDTLLLLPEPTIKLDRDGTVLVGFKGAVADCRHPDYKAIVLRFVDGETVVVVREAGGAVIHGVVTDDCRNAVPFKTEIGELLRWLVADPRPRRPWKSVR